MSEWHEIKLAPVDEVVETKIDDADGCRNIQLLRRSGQLWFSPDGLMLYYTPTHWRWPTKDQLEKLAREEEAKAQHHTDRAAAYRRASPLTSQQDRQP